MIFGKKNGKKRGKGRLGHHCWIQEWEKYQWILSSDCLPACLPPQNFPHWCYKKKSSFDCIINPSLIELVQSRWLDISIRGVLLISSDGGDWTIFLGLNFQFRDFLGWENLESTFLGSLASVGFFLFCFFLCVCVISDNTFWNFFEARKFHMGYFGG